MATTERPANVGILAMEWYAPQTYVAQTSLEEQDGCGGKYVVGLGQEAMAFVDDREDIGSVGLGMEIANPAFYVRTAHLHAGEQRRQYAEGAAPRIVRGALQLLPLSLAPALELGQDGAGDLPAPMRY